MGSIKYEGKQGKVCIFCIFLFFFFFFFYRGEFFLNILQIRTKNKEQNRTSKKLQAQPNITHTHILTPTPPTHTLHNAHPPSLKHNDTKNKITLTQKNIDNTHTHTKIQTISDNQTELAGISGIHTIPTHRFTHAQWGVGPLKHFNEQNTNVYCQKQQKSDSDNNNNNYKKKKKKKKINKDFHCQKSVCKLN